MTFSDEIIKLINTLAEKFGIAINWTSDTIIPYLEMLSTKLVNYEIATSIVWIGIAGVMILIGCPVCFKIGKIFYKKEIEYDGHRLDFEYWMSWACVLSYATGVVLMLSGIIVIGCQAFDIVTCKTFPEKIIIDYLKSLMHSST